MDCKETNEVILEKYVFQGVGKCEDLVVKLKLKDSIHLEETENKKSFLANDLEKIDASEIPISCSRKLSDLTSIDFSYNQIHKLEHRTFSNLKNLTEIIFQKSRLTEIDAGIFSDLPSLNKIDFSHNQISHLDSKIFSKSAKLSSIDFSYNLISDLDPSIFAEARNLTEIYFSYNHIADLSPKIFSSLSNLRDLFFSHNRIAQLDSSIFENLSKLEMINFSYNRIIDLNPSIFDGLKSIKIIIFKSDFQNTNRFLLWDYQKMFYEFFYVSHGKLSLKSEVFLRYVIMWFLSENVLQCNSHYYQQEEIFNLEKYLEKHPSFCRYLNYSPLDFYIALIRVPNKVIIKIIEKVNSFISQNSISEERKFEENFHFNLKSIESVSNLCRRDGRYIEKLMSNFYNYDYFEIFDFSKCFKIVLSKENQRETVAICLVKIFWLKIRTDIYANQDNLSSDVKEACLNLLSKYKFFLNDYLEECFKLNWWRFFKELLSLYEIEKDRFLRNLFFLMFEYTSSSNVVCDQEQSPLTEIESQFPIKYDWKLMKNPSQNHLLYYISASCEEYKEKSIIHHSTTKAFLDRKWDKLPFIIYYFHFLVYIAFVVFYTINLETVKNNNLVESNNYSRILSFIIVVFLYIEELLQIFIAVILHSTYFKCAQNLFEFVNYPLCIANLAIVSNNYAKTPLYVITIILTYVILIFRSEKLKVIGIYVIVFKKILRKSIGVVPLIVLTLLAFVFAFRVSTAQVLNDSDSNSQGYLFSVSFIFDQIRILTMSLSEYASFNMGLGLDINVNTYINYLTYVVFIFLLPMTIINMFLGISVGEIGKIIEDSESQNNIIRIQYILRLQETLLKLQMQLHKSLKIELGDRLIQWGLGSTINAGTQKRSKVYIYDRIIGFVRHPIRSMRSNQVCDAEIAMKQKKVEIPDITIEDQIILLKDRVSQLEERLREIGQDNEVLSVQLSHSINQQAQLEERIKENQLTLKGYLESILTKLENRN